MNKTEFKRLIKKVDNGEVNIKWIHFNYLNEAYGTCSAGYLHAYNYELSICVKKSIVDYFIIKVPFCIASSHHAHGVIKPTNKEYNLRYLEKYSKYNSNINIKDDNMNLTAKNILRFEPNMQLKYWLRLIFEGDYSLEFDIEIQDELHRLGGAKRE